MIVKPARMELIQLARLSEGSNYQSDTSLVSWPITTGGVALPSGRRAAITARRIFIPMDIAIRGIEFPNEGGITAPNQALRAKFALFNTDGNTGHWAGVNGTNTGLPSAMRVGRMDQSILVGPDSTTGSAQNLYRRGANGTTRGMRYMFDSVDLVPAGTWLWVLGMWELLYDGSGASELVSNIVPAYVSGGSTIVVLTPHQGGGGNASPRNLVWSALIGDGATAALSSTDSAGASWSNFENSTNWVNQTSHTFSLSGSSIVLSCRDHGGHIVCQF